MYIANMQVRVSCDWDGIHYVRFMSPDRTKAVHYQEDMASPTWDRIHSLADEALLKFKGAN